MWTVRYTLLKIFTFKSFCQKYQPREVMVSLTPSWLHSAGVDMCYVLGSRLSAETSQMLTFLGEATCKGLLLKAKRRNVDVQLGTGKVQ